MTGELTDEVIFSVSGRTGIVTLNRPQALNAVTLTMIRAMRRQLSEWENDDRIECVIIEAAGEKAFSAGGDIRALYDWGRTQNPWFLDYFRDEYRLNTAIKRYKKPYVALIDGIVMGGGVGVSVHGSHRFAGDRITFAMPETGIGLFPDVGGTWFLPRCPGEAGMFLGLTGARLKRDDALYCGLVTHAVQSRDLGGLKERICRAGVPGSDGFASSADTGEAPLKALQSRIDACFCGDGVEDILDRLDHAGRNDTWCAAQAEAIRTKSPTSLKITYRQLRAGRNLAFEDCMALEFRIVSRIFTGHDFFEGTRAVVVDKDNAPRWRPQRLADVSEADVAKYFEPLDEYELFST